MTQAKDFQKPPFVWAQISGESLVYVLKYQSTHSKHVATGLNVLKHVASQVRNKTHNNLKNNYLRVSLGEQPNSSEKAEEK